MGAGLDAFLASEGYIRPPIAHSTKLPDEMEIRETDRGGPGQDRGNLMLPSTNRRGPATSGVTVEAVLQPVLAITVVAATS
jgi:hypothetical protein